MSKNLSERRDELINDCMLYTRQIESEHGLTLYAFKHDEFRCDFQVFYGDCTEEFKAWIMLPIETAVSF